MHLGDTFQIGETGTLWYQNCFAALRFGVVTFELVIPLLLCMYARTVTSRIPFKILKSANIIIYRRANLLSILR